jgi:serine protease DegQ
LFNLRGEIIAIVTARRGETVTERSFGFAVPSDAIDRLLVRMP